MNKTTLVILATAVLAAVNAGCATTQEGVRPVAQAIEPQADKPVLRPFSGVGSYGGYIYRRYE
jgi:predicted small secreted protein